MKLKRVFRKEFFITLFLKQNKHHRFGVLLHSLALVYHTTRHKQYKMIPSAFLHDIGKPIITFQDEKNKITGEYSFYNHEELSYQVIKSWKILTYTKNLVRYHYLIRGMYKAKERNQIGKYKRMKRSYDKLDSSFINDLELFMKFDDLAKKSF